MPTKEGTTAVGCVDTVMAGKLPECRRGGLDGMLTHGFGARFSYCYCLVGLHLW